MSDDFEVIWHDPPPAGRNGQRLERFADLLKANPGQWGELPPNKTDEGDEYYPASVVTTFRKMYGDDYECRSLTTGTRGRVRIFARYLNDPEHQARTQLKPVR